MHFNTLLETLDGNEGPGLLNDVDLPPLPNYERNIKIPSSFVVFTGVNGFEEVTLCFQIGG